jgi:ABC-type glycerol-3-phosphate transport system substrate-binding protein
MLMAGQGPDIFMLHAHSYWHYALSGYLADIYTLIDACPYASRGDFYTNALKPFEIDGGLYALPMSFGPEYIAINASLPQPLLDRFSTNS